MTDALLVLRKLTVLREHAARVQRRRPADPADFATDEDLVDATAMSLFVAIQEAIDIAFHVAADEGWGVPSSNAEAFDMLAAHGVIDRDLAGELAAMASLRNRIAHGYASVDADRLHAELPRGLATLDRYSVAIASHVGPAT